MTGAVDDAVEQPAHTVVLVLAGDVDAVTRDGFRARADALLADATGGRLVVDMTDLTSIDSSGLGLLVQLHTATADRGMTMALRHVPRRAAALLERTGLDRVFAVLPEQPPG